MSAETLVAAATPGSQAEVQLKVTASSVVLDPNVMVVVLQGC